MVKESGIDHESPSSSVTVSVPFFTSPLEPEATTTNDPLLVALGAM